MELYSFDQKELKKDYSRLLELYLNEKSKEKKMKLHGELLPLSYYLKNSRNINYSLSREYLAKINEDRERVKNIYKSNRNLTEELCYYWSISLRRIPASEKSKMFIEFINKEDYYLDMKSFFEEVLPSDLDLFLDTFKDNHILVKRSLLCNKEEMLYLESLDKYYIKVLYS